MADTDKRDRLVQSQYESYPYPERDPADERTRLISGSPSNLAEVNHYVFGGRRDLTKPLNALIAGGGTGDAAIMLAQNLADAGVPGEVVHLDLSESSQAVAHARAEVRGLDNLRFVQGSLLDVATVAPGPWDYIDCCGVLHHLEDPDRGLAALSDQLAPDGGMGVMVYGALGRTGVYHVQGMLRMIAPAEEMPDGDRVEMAKRLAEGLPTTAWINRNGQVNDHVGGGDPGIYDLFLHARDRAYKVPDVARFAAGAGLRLVGFIEPFRYDPDWLVGDPRILKQLRALDPVARATFAELFTGNLKKHIFYAVRTENTVAPPDTDDPRAVPVIITAQPDELADKMPARGPLSVATDGLKTSMSIPALSRSMIGLCDSRRSLADIHASILERRSDLDYEGFKRQFDQLYKVLNAINQMVLRLPAEGGD
ncbi:MAG: methyltransferase [Alphaproteobacteria bacterium]|nr:methyltransferase [Alphaproteobacteria bacterium]